MTKPDAFRIHCESVITNVIGVPKGSFEPLRSPPTLAVAE
jgi:hypothetical protein